MEEGPVASPGPLATSLHLSSIIKGETPGRLVLLLPTFFHAFLGAFYLNCRFPIRMDIEWTMNGR